MVEDSLKLKSAFRSFGEEDEEETKELPPDEGLDEEKTPDTDLDEDEEEGF